MFLSLATTHRPATDLGFLLMKHPERLHEIELGFGRGMVFFPEASETRCEAALVLDVDPIGLVRGRGASEGLLDQYVNDRPYAASSFLAVALNKAFRTAALGTSRERPELAASAIPLEIRVTPLPVRGSTDLVEKLFAPLGWSVSATRLPARDGPSRYVELRLEGSMRLADALSHLYVLIPVLDDEKHYWVGDDEVEKLLAKSAAWLPVHPARELITRRYLKGRGELVRAALARLVPDVEKDEAPADWRAAAPTREEELEAPLRLHDRRLDAVAALLKENGARVVADLGCGEGKLIARLLREKSIERIFGLDASARTLERAAQRLKPDRAGAMNERATLLHGALTYRDARWQAADAVALVEVIEHLDADRLPALVEVVFGVAKPKTVIVTTPNAEYNALFEGLEPGAFRHPDHRFEWTRAEFERWGGMIAEQHGYRATYSGIGDADPARGPITQVAVFTR